MTCGPNRDRDRPIRVRLRKPDLAGALIDIGGDEAESAAPVSHETYEVETTAGEAEAIQDEIHETADAAMQHGSIDGIILDSTRYARLLAYHMDHGARNPRRATVDLDSMYSFDLHAVHAGGEEICEALYNNPVKCWEACGEGEPR